MSTVASRFNDLFHNQEIVELQSNRIEDLINYSANSRIVDIGGLTFCRLHIKNYTYLVVLILTRFGNMVVYQDENNPGIIKYVCDKRLDFMLGLEEMTLTYNDFNRIFHPTNNVGNWVESVYRMLVINDF